MKYFANIFNIFFLSGLQISLSPSQNPVSLFFRFFCVAILYVLFRFVQRNTERLVYAFIFTFRFELSTVEMKKRRGKKNKQIIIVVIISRSFVRRIARFRLISSKMNGMQVHEWNVSGEELSF